jgi:XTP/dITP diphosphohydrolase
VQSARFAGSDATDEKNNAKLVAELQQLPQDTHPAAYVCVIAIASPDAVLATFTGRLDGEIVLSPRGDGGFGYDPYFFIPQLNCTAAELTIEKKSQISHRGAALRAAINWLRENGGRLP